MNLYSQIMGKFNASNLGNYPRRDEDDHDKKT